jgi:hypothetical protein
MNMSSLVAAALAAALVAAADLGIMHGRLAHILASRKPDSPRPGLSERVPVAMGTDQ